MNGNELLKKLRKIARERNLRLKFVRERGKGSHGTLYLGDRHTIMKDRKKEIGPGLLNRMLDNLGLDKRDIESHPQHSARQKVNGHVMSEQLTYPVTIERDDEGFYLVTFPDFPEAATDGRSEVEALHEAADALDEAIAGRINRGDDIPHPSRPEAEQLVVPIPAQMAVKAALYLAVKEAGIRNVELAKRLGADEKEVRRLLDPHHKSKLPRIEAALEALGKNLVIGVEART